MDHAARNSKPTTDGRRAVLVAAVVGPLAAIALVWWVLARRGPEVTIGVEGHRTVEIAGPELHAAPFTPGDAVSVRIADVTPIPGGFRYELRYVAYGPGKHDLSQTLARADGRPLEPRDDLAIEVDTLLPEDQGGELYATAPSKIDLHSGYLTVMRGLWLLWGLLLVPLVWLGRKRRRRAAPPSPAPTIAERLRTLLQQASTEHLSPEQQADLEQLLIAFWSERLKLSGERLSELIEQLRKHPEAGRQWNRVERWLHSRPTTATNGAAARELLHDLDTLN